MIVTPNTYSKTSHIYCGIKRFLVSLEIWYASSYLNFRGIQLTCGNWFDSLKNSINLIFTFYCCCCAALATRDVLMYFLFKEFYVCIRPSVKYSHFNIPKYWIGRRITFPDFMVITTIIYRIINKISKIINNNISRYFKPL